ncbi:MAG TPA: PLP-dependent aspartate aminotransferase family protein [Nocardioidaceae bacterium]|jgi:cystathionine gamma-synthase|nr:PLP-dependent aspartate aminotransferase family protein [Nocardioidaceae bacterium]
MTAMPPRLSDLSPATIAVQAGRPPHEPDQPLNSPLVPASVFVAGGDREYGRYSNPTWEGFEEALGALEGGRCLAFASGLAAVASVLDLVSDGETVVAPRHAYLGTLHQLGELERRGRVAVRQVDIADTAEVVGALGDAALLWIESPTNPALEIADLPVLAEAAHQAGASVVCDNTFATPLRQRPLDSGVDVVVHSATKYLSGHADLVLGAVVTRDDQAWRALDERRRSFGGVPGVLEAWLALRGMRTLALRVDRSEASARELVRRLAEHPAVGRVRYPGFGGIISIELAGGAMAADLVCHATEVWVHATSLGGVESTLERRRRWTAEPTTIPEELVRLSVGCEDVDDLWRDLGQALAQIPS